MWLKASKLWCFLLIALNRLLYLLIFTAFMVAVVLVAFGLIYLWSIAFF